MKSIVDLASKGDIERVRQVVQETPDVVHHKDRSGNTALHLASLCGHIEIVRLLLAAKANVNETSDWKHTPLHCAIQGDHIQIVNLLIESGAKVDAVDKECRPPLFRALSFGHLECARILIKHDCNVNVLGPGGETVFWCLSQIKEKQIMEEILDLIEGTDVGIKDTYGWNGLHHAAFDGNVFVMKKLLSLSPGLVGEKNSSGETPLHLASRSGHLNACKALIHVGKAKLNERTNEGNTPVHCAVIANHFEVLDCLLSKGADCKVANEEGNTPLHLAIIQWCQPVTLRFRMLQLKKKPPLWKAHQEVMTEAAQKKYQFIAMASYLIVAQKADVLVENKSGKTPLDLIELGGPDCDPIKELLFELFEDSSKRQKKRTDELEAEQKRLTKRVQALEEANDCEICTERVKNVVFLCGHRACNDCGQRLTTCHVCREPIRGRISYY